MTNKMFAKKTSFTVQEWKKVVTEKWQTWKKLLRDLKQFCRY